MMYNYILAAYSSYQHHGNKLLYLRTLEAIHRECQPSLSMKAFILMVASIVDSYRMQESTKNGENPFY